MNQIEYMYTILLLNNFTFYIVQCKVFMIYLFLLKKIEYYYKQRNNYNPTFFKQYYSTIYVLLQISKHSRFFSFFQLQHQKIDLNFAPSFQVYLRHFLRPKIRAKLSVYIAFVYWLKNGGNQSVFNLQNIEFVTLFIILWYLEQNKHIRNIKYAFYRPCNSFSYFEDIFIQFYISKFVFVKYIFCIE